MRRLLRTVPLPSPTGRTHHRRRLGSPTTLTRHNTQAPQDVGTARMPQATLPSRAQTRQGSLRREYAHHLSPCATPRHHHDQRQAPTRGRHGRQPPPRRSPSKGHPTPMLTSGVSSRHVWIRCKRDRDVRCGCPVRGRCAAGPMDRHSASDEPCDCDTDDMAAVATVH